MAEKECSSSRERLNYELFVGKKMPLEEYNKFQAEQAK